MRERGDSQRSLLVENVSSSFALVVDAVVMPEGAPLAPVPTEGCAPLIVLPRIALWTYSALAGSRAGWGITDELRQVVLREAMGLAHFFFNVLLPEIACDSRHTKQQHCQDCVLCI